MQLCPTVLVKACVSFQYLKCTRREGLLVESHAPLIAEEPQTPPWPSPEAGFSGWRGRAGGRAGLG